MWSNPYSRIRVEPDIAAAEVGRAMYGQQVSIFEVDIAHDQWVWGEIAEGNYKGRYIALEEIDGFPKILQPTPPPVIVLPPPVKPRRISSYIGVHYQLPAHEYQRRALIDMCDTLHRAGKPLAAVTIVNDAPLVGDIRRVSPKTWINFRPVFSDRDPWPDFANNETGDTWFAQKWPHMVGAVGATSYQFCNEWYSKETPIATLKAWNNLYERLIEICLQHNIICTVLDLSVGTIEDYHMDIFHGCLSKAEKHGFPLDYHMYSANNRAGATDMSAGAEWFMMRWEKISARYPNLKILGGEGANSGDGNDGHLFRPETPALMNQADEMLLNSPYWENVIALCWWEMVDPDKKDFGKDDFTPILPQMQRDRIAFVGRK